MLLVALPLLGVAGCGAEPSVDAATSVTATSADRSAGPADRCAGPDQQVGVPSYGPSGYVGDLPGDMPPNYAANHAFQRRMRLCGDDLTHAAAEGARLREALGGLEPRTVETVQRALVGLGHDPRSMTVTPGASGVTFVLEAAGRPEALNFCLDGTVGPDGATVTVGGIYSEGGCIKPVGGH